MAFYIDDIAFTKLVEALSKRLSDIMKKPINEKTLYNILLSFSVDIIKSFEAIDKKMSTDQALSPLFSRISQVLAEHYNVQSYEIILPIIQEMYKGIIEMYKGQRS